MGTLGERIKSIRQSLGWTQDRLAQLAEISKSFLSEVENNKVSVSGETLLKIAQALNASLDYLMKGEPSHQQEKSQQVTIPQELSDFAEERGLSYKDTVAILFAYQSLIARRSNKGIDMTKERWRELYQNLKTYLE
jgi:transcriptional regulator with XRE-family HTH domain